MPRTKAGALRAYRPQSPLSDPLVGTAEVAAALGCHPITVWRKVKHDPDFPKPMRLSANRVAWRQSELDAYINSRPRVGDDHE